LDLQGVENINLLPTGKGKPPHQDPQVFLGSVIPYAFPQSYKTNLGTRRKWLKFLSNPVLSQIAITGYLLYSFIMASAPSAQTSAMIVESDQVNGLLTPLVGLNIPIPFMEVDQLVDDTPRASNSEVSEVTTIDNFLLATDLMACDSQIETKHSLPLAESSDNVVPRVKLPTIVSSVFQGLDPSLLKEIVDSTVLQLGGAIQAAVRDAISVMKPPARDTEMVDATRVLAVSTAASVPGPTSAPITTLAPITPVISAPIPTTVGDDGFRPVCYNFGSNNTFATINHPLLRRTSYTIFKFEDPNSPSSQLYHAGQILLFCSTSSRIIDNNFRVLTMPADYFAFAHAFNDTARLTHKRFALFDSKTKTPIIPSDPICIADFLLDQDLIRSLERTNPGFPRSGFEFRDNDSQGRREVSFKGPLPTRTRKRADTPYPRTALRKRSATGGSNNPAYT
jgi:hypothetical protein